MIPPDAKESMDRSKIGLKGLHVSVTFRQISWKIPARQCFLFFYIFFLHQDPWRHPSLQVTPPWTCCSGRPLTCTQTWGPASPSRATRLRTPMSTWSPSGRTRRASTAASNTWWVNGGRVCDSSKLRGLQRAVLSNPDSCVKAAVTGDAQTADREEFCLIFWHSMWNVW